MLGLLAAELRAVEPTPEAAQELEERGDSPAAFAMLHKLAERGDAGAMIEVGRYYYDGKGLAKDYAKAMDWWVKAFEQGHGMAYNNIAVLYRDGLGVEKNLKIAWGLLFIGHMRGLGGEAVVGQINHNLRQMPDLIPKEDIFEASRWSEDYFKRFVREKGAKPETYEALKHSRDHPPVIFLATY